MSDLINLTVRIHPKEKKEADIACEYLGTTISQVVRHALRKTVREYHVTLATDRGEAFRAMQNPEYQQAYELITDFVQSVNLHGGVVSMLDGKLVLNGRFVPNE